MDGFDVDVEQLRTHAGNLEALRDRFAAVKTASSHIAQDDLIAYAEENLTLAAKSLRDTADDYETRDNATADVFDRSVR